MGAWVFEIRLHDDEAEEFIRTALTTDWKQWDGFDSGAFQPTARYIAQRMIDACPELGAYALRADTPTNGGTTNE